MIKLIDFYVEEGREKKKYIFKLLINMYRCIVFLKELFFVISICWLFCDIKYCLKEVYFLKF